MPWRVHQRDGDVAEREPLPVASFVVLEGESRAGTAKHAGAGSGELARARDEVRVDVRLDGMCDREPGMTRRIDIHAGVAARIDHDRMLRPIAADQERALR